MSSNGQQQEKLNKKQRRKLARANNLEHHQEHSNKPEKNEQTTLLLNTHGLQINELSLPDNLESFVENSRSKEASNHKYIPKPETMGNEEVMTCEKETKTPMKEPTSNCASSRPIRLPIRRPITSAIPLLSPIEQSTGPPSKPVPGTKGERIHVFVNHFPVKVAPKLMLYQYDVVVEKISIRYPGSWEEVTNRDQRKRFVQELAKDNAFNYIYWYDEGKVFYSTVNISERKFPIIYTLRNKLQENMRLCILSLSGKWSTSTIYDYLRSPDSNTPVNVIRILEVLLKQALLPVAHCEGSLFYDISSEKTVRLPNGYELRLGFFQALYLTQGGLTLNLQTTLTKFFPHMDILDFLQIYLDKDVKRFGMTSSDYEKARVALNGCKITTRQSNFTQIYRIRAFSDIPERQTIDFQKDIIIDGKATKSTVQYNLNEYYQIEKGIQIQLKMLRCLQCFFLHERVNPKHIPMELCRILEWQECERESVDEQRGRQNHSIPSPDQRYKDIMMSLRTCNYSSPPTLTLCKAVQFAVTDGNEMKCIQGRILSPPVINDNYAEINMGRINLKGTFVKPHKLTSVVFAYFGPPGPIQSERLAVLRKFTKSFHKMAEQYSMGPIRTSKNDIIGIFEPQENREENIQAVETYFEQRKKENRELIVCIMDTNWNELRPTIKFNGTSKHGITTQCLLYSKLEEQIERFSRTRRGHPDRILDNMCENLLRKINFKMQGTNTKVNLPIHNTTKNSASSKIRTSDDAWQFIGADVLHPVCRQEKPSIAAVVGSGDSVCSTSAVRVCKQWPRNGKCAIEAIVDLQQMVTELLEYYREANERLPNKVVFYRDGVDDGQFTRVLNFEIPQIKAAFRELYQDEPQPLLTFLVVKKRHHTRFFTLDQFNQTANIPPGLVVDTDIVHPAQFSFFLNSHRALQGTNRPALYHVLYDEIKFTSDELQLLTYYLCFTDPRSSTSEAIPSVVHQADVAASNARDLFPDKDTSTVDGYAVDALEEPSLSDIQTEHLRVHENMRDTPHFG